MGIYVVEPNDTVDLISSKLNIPVDEIIYANQIVYPYALAEGQALFVRNDAAEDRTALNVNGYAYPFINELVLEQTIPYLTRLSVFSYGFDTEGKLIAPKLNDDFMIEAALAQNTRPILTLTPFGPDGRFSNNLISALVNNNTAVETLIEDIINTMRSKGFMGTDVDFEYIYAEDRDAFTTFVRRLTERLNAEGFTVSVALAPKTSNTQQGLLYEGKDYGGLGASANSVLLMTYEWGYKYVPY